MRFINVIRELWIAASFAIVAGQVLAESTDQMMGPCAAQLANGTVCESASTRALEIMKKGNLRAITVVQDTHTGSLVAYASSDPDLDVTTPLLPLSTVKLMVAASWWDHEQAQQSESSNTERLLTDMIVSGNDTAGRQIASLLRERIGTEGVLKDLENYGFPSKDNSAAREKDAEFWTALPPRWRDRLTPAKSYHSLGRDHMARDWEDTLSIGEANFTVTALHLSRFLQAVGNGGLMVAPRARAEDEDHGQSGPGDSPIRVMKEGTALKLRAAMRSVVERGTAKSAAIVLADTGWQIGGKTGTGPNAPGPESDGWFAGLIFDPQGNARFTVATFVKHGGYGGGNAARISAELARFIIGTNTRR